MKLKVMMLALITEVVFSLSAMCQMPDIDGHWVGSVFQAPGGTHFEFDFELSLVVEGTNVTGTSRISVPGKPEYYGVLSLKGEISQNVLTFREMTSLENYPEPRTVWCRKRGSLEFSMDNGSAQLNGDWTALGCAPGRISVRRQSLLCNDRRLVQDYDAKSPNYHSYGSKGEIETLVCATINARCNDQLIFRTMLEESRFIAPSDDKTPVTNCKISRVTIGFSDDNEIRTTVDQQSLTITNYTIEGRHKLHPGRVVRSVVERDGQIYIRTQGEGLGSYGDLNELLSPIVWGGVDKKLRLRLNSSAGKDSPNSPR